MIPLMKSTFLDEHETKKELCEFIMRTNKFSMDEQCFLFERRFAEFQERRECILFNSGGSANLALLQACKNLGLLKNGSLVGFSGLTWSTNVMPIIQMGFTPVAVDCAVNTLNVMSSNLLDTLESFDLKALFITNVLGFTGDLDRIKEICQERNILLLEDNCESLGTRLSKGTLAGNFGIASTFSYFVAHHMSTIEGGSVCTDNEELAEMLRIVRANGWDRNLTATQQKRLREREGVESEFQAKYTFYDLGFNLRPTEITGFLGQTQLKHLEQNLSARLRNYTSIETVIRDNINLVNLERSHINFLSSFAFPVIAKTPELKMKYFQQFSGAGIEIRPMIAGNMQKQPFYKKYVLKNNPLINTDIIHNQGFYCGNYPELSNSDIEMIKSSLMN